MNASAERPARLTTVQWLIVSMAALGFAFDIYELLMAQFIIRPAIMELTGAKPGTQSKQCPTCHGRGEERHFLLRVDRFRGDGPVRLVLA